MFGSVASALDNAISGSAAPALPHHLRKTYSEFISRLQSVAKEFIENHVRGVPNSNLKPTHQDGAHQAFTTDVPALQAAPCQLPVKSSTSAKKNQPMPT